MTATSSPPPFAHLVEDIIPLLLDDGMLYQGPEYVSKYGGIQGGIFQLRQCVTQHILEGRIQGTWCGLWIIRQGWTVSADSAGLPELLLTVACAIDCTAATCPEWLQQSAGRASASSRTASSLNYGMPYEPAQIALPQRLLSGSTACVGTNQPVGESLRRSQSRRQPRRAARKPHSLLYLAKSLPLSV